jgi:hypothetical protein
VKHPQPRQARNQTIASRTQKTLLPLFAVGGSLAAAPANALELGDAVVQSRLGQPLRASIAFALAPKEQLFDNCVSLGTGISPSGLPGIGRATISIADGALIIQGSTPVREPLIATNIVVKCPSTAKLSREYMMFIDPPGIEINPQPAAQSVQATTAVVSSPAVNQPTTAKPVAAAQPDVAPARRQSQGSTSQDTVARNVAEKAPIGQATRYRVRPGDSLSEITQRVENRSVRLWPAVNLIFEANPHAFIDNDPNRLKAGSWLTIPSLDGSKPVISGTSAASEPLYEAPAAAAEPPVQAVTPQQEPATSPVAEPEAEAEASAADFTNDLRPAEVAQTADNTLVDVRANETIAIPDVALEAPQTTSSLPNVTEAAISPAVEQTQSSSWLLWLVGAGVTVILALLLFGRSLRSRFTPAPLQERSELPLAASRRPREPASDEIGVNERVDWGLRDDAPTTENPVLDADLVMGTGLGAATEPNPFKEIGFPTPTELDLELPFDPQAAEDTLEIDTLSTSASRNYGITIETEQLPEEDTEYDLSDITNAAEMPHSDDADEADLNSIEVEAIDETVLLNDDTVDPSIAFEILERDYEDELSATQALSKEVAQAALDLTTATKVMSDKTEKFALDDDKTAALSLASVTELDLVSSDDDIAANDDETREMAIDDSTVEMPSVDDDETEIMSRKRRSADGKKAG